MAEQRARLTRGEWIDPASSRVPFGPVAEEWLTAAVHLKPKTRASYSSLLRTRILPTWEWVQLSKITHEAVASWVGGMATVGLSASRVRQAVYVLSAVCEYAVRTDRLIRNPTTGVRLPRIVRHAERRYITQVEVAALARAAGRSGAAHGRFVRLLATRDFAGGGDGAEGAGRGPVSAAYDVQRAFADVSGGLVEGTPKSHQRRTVPLLPLVVDDLVQQLAERAPDEMDTWAAHLDGVTRGQVWAESGQDHPDEGDDGAASVPASL